MLKNAVKRAVSESLGRLVVGRAESRVVILCYHSIHPSLPFASASPELFRAHLEYLTGECDVVPLSDVQALARGGARTRPAVALTFDDGYRDNHTYALPLLDEAGATATFFVTVGLLERDPAVLARLADIRGTSHEDVAGMSWEQARELVAAGHEVASHTWSHPVLADLDAGATRTELVRAKDVLEERLGVPAPAFAYPFGKPGRHFTAVTEQAVREAGHTRAVAILARRVRAEDPPLALPRFFATRDDVQTLAAKVAGRWDWLGLWQEHTPRWLAKLVSPADFRDPAEAGRSG
jgi:peptidoglycan/xylan/chitin deacetylase (PgdA/CDA1 family)